ncbi:MAG: bifunctional 5,10-methylenetetrahydrofolate dehydrogenase/5,10-methenyltetrahydrofolate cyclohydrolase, partial [Candidatus Aenigmatarchaeota archaeon]
MATVLVGENSSSQTYVKLKRKDCKEVGIDFELHNLSSDVSQSEVMDLIRELNQDGRIDGIIVQMPVPSHLDEKKILKKIEPSKDVDGLNPYNVGKLWTGGYDFENDLLSCTPKGIMRLLDYYDIDLEGERAVIINRSDLVGKPLSKLMLDRNATVTICHSRTRDIQAITKRSDIQQLRDEGEDPR